MRILFWTQLYRPHIGGVEVFTANLAAALQARGHEVAVVTSHSDLDLPDEEAINDVPVYRLPIHSALVGKNPMAFLDVRQRVVRLRKDYAPDVVHLQFSDPGAIFLLETQGADTAPFLATIQTLRKHRAGPGTLMGRMLTGAGWVVAISQAIMGELLALEPSIAGRSSIIYNGVPIPAEAPAPRPREAPKLVCPGRVVADKGFDVALDAFARLAPDFPDARLVIAGDGPEREGLEAQARKLGIDGAVGFRGWVAPSAIPALMNEASIVVVPSRWAEPFGIVAVEAALMARPVVASRTGGLAEVVADGESGLLVEPENPDALALAIRQLLENPVDADRMGRQARERATALFGFERVTGAYEALYRKLVEGVVDG